MPPPTPSGPGVNSTQIRPSGRRFPSNRRYAGRSEIAREAAFVPQSRFFPHATTVWRWSKRPPQTINCLPMGSTVRPKSLAARALRLPPQIVPNDITTVACSICGTKFTARISLAGSSCWQCGSNFRLRPPGAQAPNIDGRSAGQAVPSPQSVVPRRRSKSAPIRRPWHSSPILAASACVHFLVLELLALTPVPSSESGRNDLVLHCQFTSDSAVHLSALADQLTVVPPDIGHGDRMPEAPAHPPAHRRQQSAAFVADFRSCHHEIHSALGITRSPDFASLTLHPPFWTNTEPVLDWGYRLRSKRLGFPFRLPE
ncbi:MAG: hypothetical protein O3C60_04950 [Planctomycetota bacterium]|nr:hypothetical protein [Planctomycetota bacterium]